MSANLDLGVTSYTSLLMHLNALKDASALTLAARTGISRDHVMELMIRLEQNNLVTKKKVTEINEKNGRKIPISYSVYNITVYGYNELVKIRNSIDLCLKSKVIREGTFSYEAA